MDFRRATDELFRAITQQDLANTIEVSVDSVRQARLRAGAHRKAGQRPSPASPKIGHGELEAARRRSGQVAV